VALAQPAPEALAAPVHRDRLPLAHREASVIADLVFLDACGLAAILLGLYVPRMRQQWRNARGVIELTETEAAARCDACSDPSGMAWCVCPVNCGHRLCRGRHSHARWTEGDMDVLAGDMASVNREGQW
jgi:hypothetical protein